MWSAHPSGSAARPPARPTPYAAPPHKTCFFTATREVKGETPRLIESFPILLTSEKVAEGKTPRMGDRLHF